jgi:low affinity Fe/Cu permease
MRSSQTWRAFAGASLFKGSAMTLGLCFWILMLVWLVFGLLVHFAVVAGAYTALGNTVLLFILFLLLGWQVFGPPIHR